MTEKDILDKTPIPKENIWKAINIVIAIANLFKIRRGLKTKIEHLEYIIGVYAEKFKELEDNQENMQKEIDKLKKIKK